MLGCRSLPSAILFAVLAIGCPSRPPAALRPPPLGSPNVSPAPKTGVVIEATEYGIIMKAGPPPGMVLTVKIGRHLRLDGEILYFFDPELPTLQSVELKRRGSTKVVMVLPPVEHIGFPQANPLVYLQREEDLSVESGVLCADLNDHGDGSGLVYNIRVDLIRRSYDGRLIRDGRNGRNVETRLCTPKGPLGDGRRIEVEYGEIVPLVPLR